MAKKKTETPKEEPKTIIAYKGFDKDFKCLGFQFEIGKTFEHDGPVEACKSGFHACEYPLDVFGYYEPGISQYAIVEQGGTLDKKDDDSKVASSKITIKASLSIGGLVDAAIAYTKSFTKEEGSNHTTGDRSASSATGDRSASSATGYRSASSATGYQSASSATGYQSASSATGYQSASSATGLDAVAAAFGYASKAKATKQGILIIAWHDEAADRKRVSIAYVGESGIKADTWYALNEKGEFMEVGNAP